MIRRNGNSVSFVDVYDNEYVCLLSALFVVIPPKTDKFGTVFENASVHFLGNMHQTLVSRLVADALKGYIMEAK